MADNDGVVEPSGALFVGALPVILAAGVPVTTYLTQPGGLFGRLLDAVVSLVTYVGTAGATSTVNPSSMIPTLSVLYIFGVFALGGATSVGALDMSAKEGRNNLTPRVQVPNLKGLPLRMFSAHEHMMEIFPGFTLSAALAMIVAPTDPHIINLLGLHVLSKLLIFWPSYLANLGIPRTTGHLLSISSMIGVAWKIARFEV